jgi:hypothetical protein
MSLKLPGLGYRKCCRYSRYWGRLFKKFGNPENLCFLAGAAGIFFQDFLFVTACCSVRYAVNKLLINIGRQNAFIYRKKVYFYDRF